MDIERILIYIFVFMVTCSIINYLNTKNKILRYNIILNVKISEEDIKILDIIINNSFEEYLILNEIYKDVDYITSEHENKICKELTNIVGKRISESLFERLSLYYNKKELPYIISNRIYLVVMNYTMSHNKS